MVKTTKSRCGTKLIAVIEMLRVQFWVGGFFILLRLILFMGKVCLVIFGVLLSLFVFLLGCTFSFSFPEDSDLVFDSNCVGLPYLDSNNFYFGEGKFELFIGGTYVLDDFNLTLNSIDERTFLQTHTSSTYNRAFTFEVDRNGTKEEFIYCDAYNWKAEPFCSLNKIGQIIGRTGVVVVPTKFDCVETKCGSSAYDKSIGLCKKPTRFNLILIDLDKYFREEKNLLSFFDFHPEATLKIFNQNEDDYYSIESYWGSCLSRFYNDPFYHMVYEDGNSLLDLIVKINESVPIVVCSKEISV